MHREWKTRVGRLAVAGALALIMNGAVDDAQAQAICGQNYAVARGDTLSLLSLSVLGDAGRWIEIYEFSSNPDKIGRNPDQLLIGTELSMPPCPNEGARPVDIAIPSVPVIKDGGFVKPIEIVTGGDYVPFTDDKSDHRGMITQIVEAAFAAAELPNRFEIDFINDWGAHLNILLPEDKYDFGFPWFRPDCMDPTLPDDMLIRCEYVWSDPLYRVPVAFYAAANRAGSPSSFAELQGQRICRPSGYFTFDLAAEGLVNGKTIELLQPDTVAECFTALERGDVDFVSLNRFTADAEIARSGLTGIVAPINTLITLQELHLVAYRDNIDAAFDWMPAFNAGLRKIQKNGLYDKIQSFHLQEYRNRIHELAQ